MPRGLKNKFDNTVSAWHLRTGKLTFGRQPALMAIVNVTPDSFSDGGRFATTELAINHAMQLVEQGADILDIGGESTRPYSTPVGTVDELARVIPVIRELVKRTDTPISIDTSKSEVARQAVEAGAEIINDVTGLQGDPEMVVVARETGAGVCAMHMRGTPQTMQDDPSYANVAEEIHEYLNQRKLALLDSGIEMEKICLDPGIGFGKTHEHNFELLHSCESFHELNCPLLVGHSRKGFIGKAIDDKEANRDPGTLAITLMLAQKAIQIVRIHEIANTRQALTLFDTSGAIDGERPNEE
jgi:dihydropteroate synthase